MRVDEEKVITMARLAQYDKHYGRADLYKNRYFRHDYIYKKNAAGRGLALIGLLFIVALYELRKIVTGGVDLLQMDYRAEVIKIAAFVIIVLAVYTLIGTFVYTREYQKSQKRLEWYYDALTSLNERTRWLEKRKRAEGGLFRTIVRRNNDGAMEKAYEKVKPPSEDGGGISQDEFESILDKMDDGRYDDYVKDGGAYRYKEADEADDGLTGHDFEIIDTDSETDNKTDYEIKKDDGDGE